MACTHEHGKNRVVATCPACQKKVYLHHVLEARSLLGTGAASNPLTSITMIHGAKPGRHALTLYVDKNMAVRGTEVSRVVIVTRK